MEFTVKKFDLLRELTLTQGVVEKKTTIPILSNLLLESKGEQIALTATDLELGIKSVCAAKVKKEGAGTVPAKRLFDIVRSLPDAEIRCKLLENHWVEIRCEKSNFRLVGMAKDNFPSLPAFPHKLVSIPAALLQTMITKTIFAISAEESRYTLNGALLLVKPDSITMVSTDGHRLAHIETEHAFAGVRSEIRALVPRKAMTEIQRLLTEAGEKAEVEMGQDESHLFFKLGERLLIARQLTGQFPNYEAVLPRENNKIVVLERDDIAAAIRRVSLVADQRSHAIRMAVEKDRVELSATSSEYGEAKEEITPKNEYKDEALQIGFNAQYLMDFLSAAAEGPINFEFKDEQSAGQMRPLNEAAFKYRYIVMPMRI